jgi:hypothetical protein
MHRKLDRSGTDRPGQHRYPSLCDMELIASIIDIVHFGENTIKSP